MSKASIASSSVESCSSHYIYLIQTREFIKTNEPVYKIGKTTQAGMNRMKQYPKGSRIILFMKCKNCHDLERIIKEKFIKKYRIRRDIGSEYFEGDEEQMYWTIIHLLIKENIKTDENSDEESAMSDSNTSDTDRSSDDKEDSDNMKEEEIVVSSYEDYMKYSKIREIIIISKKTHEGYLRFDHTTWRHLHNIKHAERNGQETLDGFIRTYSNHTSTLFRDIVTNKIGTFTDMKDSRHLCLVNINYRYDSIIKDIIEKCYQEHPNEFVPQYHQFFVGTSLTGKGYCTQLFDAKDVEFYPIEHYINGKYTTRSEGNRYFRTEGYCDVDVVDAIMRQLIPYSQHRNSFHTLCHAVLVDGFSSPYVFYDTCYTNEHHQLSSWLSSVTYTLGIGSIPILDLLNVSSKKSALSEFIKENTDTRARCVTLVNISEAEIDPYIETIRNNLGIMCFIVCKKTNDPKESIYDFNGYKKYAKENYELIKYHIPPSTRHHNFVEYVDDIFYSTEMLFTNFLKWCVSR